MPSAGSAELHYARKMFEAGALKLEAPQNIAAFLADIRRWGEFGMIPALNARRTPNRVAVIDDDGEFTFKELDDAAHAVGQRAAGNGRQGWRRGGDPGAQPPVVPRRGLRRRARPVPASSC